jgi:hypothetical protein
VAIKLRKGFNPIAMKGFILALQKRPRTVQSIAAETGITETTIRVWLELFRIEVPGMPRLIYIADWKKTGSIWTAMYMWGNEDDVLKPKPLTYAEHSRNWRRRKALATERKTDNESLGYLPR